MMDLIAVNNRRRQASRFSAVAETADGSPVEGIFWSRAFDEYAFTDAFQLSGYFADGMWIRRKFSIQAPRSVTPIFCFIRSVFTSRSSSNKKTLYFCIGDSGAADWPVTKVTIRQVSPGEQTSMSVIQTGKYGARGSGASVQLSGSTYSGNGNSLTGPNDHVILTYDSVSHDGFTMNAHVSFQFEVSDGVCHVGQCSRAKGNSIPLICYRP